MFVNFPIIEWEKYDQGIFMFCKQMLKIDIKLCMVYVSPVAIVSRKTDTKFSERVWENYAVISKALQEIEIITI